MMEENVGEISKIHERAIGERGKSVTPSKDFLVVDSLTNDHSTSTHTFEGSQALFCTKSRYLASVGRALSQRKTHIFRAAQSSRLSTL